MKTKLLDRPELTTCRCHFEHAAEASREHSRLVSELLKKHGGHGPQISGIIRDHFPEADKTRLRELAQQVTAQNEAGRAARPRGIRRATIDNLAREVCRVNGTGFYGYRV